ncbi:MAG: alpha/beta hydrolase [Rhodospirillales bacterium]|nr:alpha/beta hydrolase [Rhodospirillales bacterium]
MHRFAADDGTEIRVQVAGSGPPIVLLHEWASSHRVWEPIAHRLADRFTIYRWDARGHHGHGEALPPVAAGVVSVERMADDLACLLDHFRLQRPVVIGHSMGALTLWAYVARHGCAELGKVGIIDQSPKLTTDAAWRLGIYGDWPAERDAAFVAGMRADFVETVVRLVCCGLNRRARTRFESGHPGIERLRTYLAMLDNVPLIEVWETLSRADFRPVLPTIVVPALLVYGGESNYYPPATGPYVRDAMPDARLLIYDGTDHSPHVADPDRFAADLAGFAAGG